jgi:hypothetical protein
VAKLLALVMSVSLGLGNAQQQPQSQTAKSPHDKADKAADQILQEQNESDELSWYDDLYPALKRKYRKSVTRSLYDTWREIYFRQYVAPALISKGYGYETVRRQFMAATEKQPSN